MEEALMSRNASLNILREMILRGTPFDVIEDKHLKALELREQKLARAIVMATLRHMGEISFLIDHFMKTPFDDDSIEKNIMRIGIAQLLYMESIPAHAAIHGSVELAKSRGKQRATGVINAILRRTQREGESLLAEKQSYEFNVPLWLRQKIEETYPEKRRQKIYENMLKSVKLDIRVRGDFSEEERQTLEQIAYQIPIHNETYRLKRKSTRVQDVPGWDDGRIYVQDAASQMPARLLKQDIPEGPILDLCSAPGGKSIQLSDLFPKRHCISADINPRRLVRVSENFKRCHISNSILCMDGQETAFPDESFSAILLDAPCSATGTTRRHPDVLLLRNEAHIESLKDTQQSLLKEAVRLLKPKGVLVYSTCSLLPEESELQIEELLRTNPILKRSDISPAEVGDNPLIINEQGELRATPAENLDGFFAARLIKS